MERRRFIFVYGGIFFLALILRIGIAVFANGEELRTIRPDTGGYLTPARSLVETGNYNSTRRPPGFPVLAAAVFKCGGGERTLSFILAGLSAFSVLAVARAGYLYKGHTCAIIAGSLYALHPTVLGNVPLLLTDTWAGIFAALQYMLFLEFYRNKKWWGFFGCAGVAAIGALIRPVNMFFIVPLLFLLACTPKIDWRKKAVAALVGTMLFCAIIFPWMIRNSLQGAGFCIDTNTGAMYHQNGAMLLGEVTGRGYEFEKQRILQEQAELFKDTSCFPDEKSREAYRIAMYKALVREHFPVWLKQQMNYQILLPDVPSFLECLGVTSSDRGTMAVLKEAGIFSAVKHYFGKDWLMLLSAVLPLLAVAAITMAGAVWTFFKSLVRVKREYMELFIFGAFVYYYLFLPGAITAPRYQIPALPCLSVMAALALLELIGYIRKRCKGENGNEKGESAAVDA